VWKSDINALGDWIFTMISSSDLVSSSERQEILGRLRRLERLGIKDKNRSSEHTMQ
jgi:hypothetical protein